MSIGGPNDDDTRDARLEAVAAGIRVLVQRQGAGAPARRPRHQRPLRTRRDVQADHLAAAFAAVRQAMLGVGQVHKRWIGSADAPFGTAHIAFENRPQLSTKYLGRVIQVAAETGTAERTGLPAGQGRFIGFAPAGRPTIAVAAHVREGGKGVLSGGAVALDTVAACFGTPAFEVPASTGEGEQ